jgi:hypothetical protein
MIALPAAEGVLDASGIAPRIEAVLPSGARTRQLSARTLLLGMMLALADGRPAHLTRVHQALTSLPGDEQRRLGVLADWKDGPHLLTYRQAEYTFALVTAALAKDEPDGLPSRELQDACDSLLEASVPRQFRDASSSLAVDWTDLESFSRPPPRGTSDCADPEASWGHRKDNLTGSDDELFFGYYLSAAVTVPDEQGPPVPELARRMTLSSCRRDPVPAFTPVLTAMPAAGIPLGDVLADSGYSHRVPGNWAAPLRRAGAALVQDLHPHDRGPRGTHAGAVIANGNLYCPATPRILLELAPLARGAAPGQAAGHDAKTAEAARYKLGRLTSDDEDGYHRVHCPAAAGKIRCPLRPPSMTLDRDRPEILSPRSTPRPAAPSRPSPSPRASWPRPRRNTTTPPPPGAAPTPAAPPPSAASPPSRTPPPATPPAAGAASPASRPSRCSPQCCSPSATSGSSPPGTPAKTKTPAAPPRACPRKPAGAAAGHPPRRPTPRSRAPPRSASMPAHARHPPRTAKRGAYGAPNHAETGDVRPKRENGREALLSHP